MSFFGKLVAPEQDAKRSKPLKLPLVNKEKLLQRFERTLVGRLLTHKATEQRLQAMIGFLPTVWKCEGKVQGILMDEGRVHFRFQQEEDLQKVVEERPYHFDNWMLALERWVPTVRLDFPTTIPFWINVKGLPDFYCDEEAGISIGEDLGEFLQWDSEPATPRIKVMLAGDAPLLFRRETVSDSGELFSIRFKYEKLQNYCTVCCCITHEADSCRNRVVQQNGRREHYRENNRGGEGKEAWQRAQVEIEERRRGQRKQEDKPSIRKESGTCDKVMPRPVRRELLPEQEEPVDTSRVTTESEETTRSWVSREFDRKGGDRKRAQEPVRAQAGRESRGKQRATAGEGGKNEVWVRKPTHGQKDDGLTVAEESPGEKGYDRRPSWYGKSEQEAKLYNQMSGQLERWAAVDGERKSAKVEPERVSPEIRVVATKSGRREEEQSRMRQKEKEVGPIKAHQQNADQISPLGPHEVISPLKDLVKGATLIRHHEKKKQVVSQAEKRISKALGVKKKIAHSPCRGSRFR